MASVTFPTVGNALLSLWHDGIEASDRRCATVSPERSGESRERAAKNCATSAAPSPPAKVESCCACRRTMTSSAINVNWPCSMRHATFNRPCNASAALPRHAGPISKCNAPATVPSPSAFATSAQCCRRAARPLPPSSGRRRSKNRSVQASLAGAPIYSADGVKVGEVTAVKSGLDGKPQMIQAAMGSRLGLGATPVLITPDEFEMRTDGLQLRMRADQIEAVLQDADFGTKAVGTTHRHVKLLAGGGTSKTRGGCRRAVQALGSRLDDVVANGVANQSGRRRQVELAHHCRSVRLHRFETNHQHVRDLLVRVTLGD